jgi:hypothetical protein
MSYPPDHSFNDAIDSTQLRKITMSSPRIIANLIKELGPNCVLSKVDQSNAYKNIGVRPSQWHLQGFKWMDKYFVETRLVFGSESAPNNYDNFSGGFSEIVRAETGLDPKLVPRVLDDQMCITKTLEENERFMEAYVNKANSINLPLADLTNEEKCFFYKSKGKILGVIFCTKTMSWTFDDKKIARFMFCLQEAKRTAKVSLHTIQRILGMINTIVQLCPTLKCYRNPFLLELIDAYKRSPTIASTSFLAHIHGWLYVLEALKKSFPIPEEILICPMDGLFLISDAAGLSKSVELTYDIGVGGAVYTQPDREVIVACTGIWDRTFIANTYDEKGCFLGNKSTTLEALGVIFVLYHSAHLLTHKVVQIECDNVAVVYALENGRCRNDRWASQFIAAILFVTTVLQCKIIPTHCRRMSTTPAIVADLLTRDDKLGRAMVSRLTKGKVPILSGWPPSIRQWMKDPTCSDTFRLLLLRDFQEKIDS